jgi:septal ring factor EnvC (AmiA/AmiB activator)
MKYRIIGVLLIVTTVSMLFISCSSKPSKEELSQLEALNAEIATLEQTLNKLEEEKSSLQKSIAEKDTKLAELRKTKSTVEDKLKGIN